MHLYRVADSTHREMNSTGEGQDRQTDTNNIPMMRTHHFNAATGMRKAVEQYLLINSPDKTKEPEQRTTQLSSVKQSKQAANIYMEGLFKKTLFFRELLLVQTLKFQQIISCLAPYSRLVEFRAGDVVTVTGELRTHIFWLLKGEVYIFVPTSESAFQASIKLHNPKPTRYKNKAMLKLHRRERPVSPTKIISTMIQLESDEKQISLIQAYDVFKDQQLASELINSHTYKELMGESLKLSVHPSQWHVGDVHDDCISVCKRPTVCLAVPIAVYNAIDHYLGTLKRKEIIRMLLDVFGNLLTYEEVERYAEKDAHHHSVKLLRKEELKMRENSYYVVLEGQLETEVGMIKETGEKTPQADIPLAVVQQEQLVYRKVCLSKKGDLIQNCSGIPATIKVTATSSDLTRVFRLDEYWMSIHLKKHAELRSRIEGMVSTRNELIMKICLSRRPQSPTALLHTKHRPSAVSVIKSRQSIEQIEFLESLRKPLSSQKRRLSENSLHFRGKIEQEKGSIRYLVSDESNNHTKIIRKKNIVKELTDRELCNKLGMMSQYQITQANDRILKAQQMAKWIRDKDFQLSPLIKPRKLSLPRLPAEQKMFSKRCQNIYNCQK